MLYDYKGYGEARFVGLDNFVRVFTRDPVFWDSVVNTFVYVGGKLIITLPIAFLIAVMVNKSFRRNAVVQSIIFTPTNYEQRGYGADFLPHFHTYNGSVNKILMSLGLINPEYQLAGR